MATNVVSSVIVVEALTENNYANWSACVKNYLFGQDLWDIVGAASSVPKPEDDEVGYRTWKKKDAIALHAIQISCSPDMLSHIRESHSAKHAWDTLAKMQEPQVEYQVEAQVEYQVEQGIKAPLKRWIARGDWDVVNDYFSVHPGAMTAKIDGVGSTALHVATAYGHANIVEKLVERLTEEDMEIVDSNGATPFMLAAVNGSTKIAKCMFEKNSNLVSIPNRWGNLPVAEACARGNKDIALYLYSVSLNGLGLLHQENDENGHGSMLLHASITAEMYDIALDLLQRFPQLAITKNREGNTPLLAFAKMPFAFYSGNRLVFWQRWIYSCICVNLPAAANGIRIDISQQDQNEQQHHIVKQVFGRLRGLVSKISKLFGIKQIYELKFRHVYARKLLNLMCEKLRKETHISMVILGAAIFDAVQHGIVEFIVEIIKVNPEMVDCIDGLNSRDIIMSAIEHRHEKIFSLIYGLDAWKKTLACRLDKQGNTMLHLAGMLVDSTKLARISGAALQMQRELQWFKEVESIVPNNLKQHLNKDEKTPHQLFTEHHKDLVKEGEKWMKDSSSSSTVVGTLIITITFAAAFTVPGGNNQITGFPIFLHSKSFMVFIISDAISLFASSTSVLMFLGILTSRYAEDDFLISLPRKLIIGFFTLFFSIATMMVAFSAALFTILHDNWWIVPIMLLASIPIILFILLQFPLLLEMLISTYGLGIFNRSMKRLY